MLEGRRNIYKSLISYDKDFAQNLLVSLFYETVLDMKDAFEAKHVYIEIKDNFIRVYFEDSALYFDNYKNQFKTIINLMFFIYK